MLRALAARMAPGRAVWRFLHVDRAVPADLAGAIRVDRALGERLAASDRYPFYGVVPAAVGAAEA